MKRIMYKLVLVAGLAVLLCGAPAMAADGFSDRPSPDGNTSASSGPGPVDLEFLDRPRDGRREKPKPKRRDPGRQNMNGLEAVCINDGFLADLFGGLTGIARRCSDDGESFLRRTR